MNTDVDILSILESIKRHYDEIDKKAASESKPLKSTKSMGVINTSLNDNDYKNLPNIDEDKVERLLSDIDEGNFNLKLWYRNPY